MQSMLEELYLGNIGFDSGRYPQNSPLVNAARRKLDSMEKLDAMLDDDGRELFERFCDAQADLEGMTRYDTYMAAIRFGILLMAEIFTDSFAETGGEQAGAL